MTFFRDLLIVATGGAFGAMSRHCANLAAIRVLGDSFPYGTLLVNVVGCFLLGLLAELALARQVLPAHLQTGVTVGFLGALTTFSTFGHETWRHLEKNQWSLALGNIGANCALGLLAVWAGISLIRFWLGDR